MVFESQKGLRKSQKVLESHKRSLKVAKGREKLQKVIKSHKLIIIDTEKKTL